jgi:exonuclease VII small subunit
MAKLVLLLCIMFSANIRATEETVEERLEKLEEVAAKLEKRTASLEKRLKRLKERKI